MRRLRFLIARRLLRLGAKVAPRDTVEFMLLALAGIYSRNPSSYRALLWVRR